MKPLTIDELTSWEDHGATWRLVEAEAECAVVEMCTCYGEPVDLRVATDPALVELVRARRSGGLGGGLEGGLGGGHEGGPRAGLRDNERVKLYVCYGTFKHAPRPSGQHPCGLAYHALVDAGHKPEVIHTYGAGLLGRLFNPSRGRREVKRLTGSYMVPVLLTDNGEVVTESREIAKWAKAHPAAA